MINIALLFPGQGSQQVGMGENLCQNFPVARRTFEEAGDTLGFSLSKLCFEGDIKELTKTYHAQPALLTVSVASYRVLVQNLDLKVRIGAGHSLGEFSALTCSGMLDFQDALKIVKRRGELMYQACNQSDSPMMVAVSNMKSDELNYICETYRKRGKVLSVACYNSPNQNVVSGEPSAVTEFMDEMGKKNITVKALRVSGAFHSDLMIPAAAELEREIGKYKTKEGQWPVLSNLTARPYESNKQIVKNLVLQLSRPVKWMESMRYLTEQNIEFAIELGPQNVLKQLMKHNNEYLKTCCLNNASDMNKIKEELSALLNYKKSEIVRKCIVEAICCKNNSKENYSTELLKPFYEIKNIYEQIMQNIMEVTDDHVRDAVEMLKYIRKIKKAGDSIMLEELLND